MEFNTTIGWDQNRRTRFSGKIPTQGGERMPIRIAAVLATILIIAAPVTAQSLPNGITAQSVPISGTISYNNELVDIQGSLYVVRAVSVTSKGTALVLFGELAPNTTAIGETTGDHYALNGTATLTRNYQGPIPSSATATLSFAIFGTAPSSTATVTSLTMSEPMEFGAQVSQVSFEELVVKIIQIVSTIIP